MSKRLSLPLALQWWLFCLLLSTSTIVDNDNILINFTYSNIACCNLDCCTFFYWQFFFLHNYININKNNLLSLRVHGLCLLWLFLSTVNNPQPLYPTTSNWTKHFLIVYQLNTQDEELGSWRQKFTKENSNLEEMLKLFSRRFMPRILPIRCITQDIQSIDKIPKNFYMP